MPRDPKVVATELSDALIEQQARYQALATVEAAYRLAQTCMVHWANMSETYRQVREWRRQEQAHRDIFFICLTSIASLGFSSALAALWSGGQSLTVEGLAAMRIRNAAAFVQRSSALRAAGEARGVIERLAYEWTQANAAANLGVVGRGYISSGLTGVGIGATGDLGAAGVGLGVTNFVTSIGVSALVQVAIEDAVGVPPATWASHAFWNILGLSDGQKRRASLEKSLASADRLAIQYLDIVGGAGRKLMTMSPQQFVRFAAMIEINVRDHLRQSILHRYSRSTGHAADGGSGIAGVSTREAELTNWTREQQQELDTALAHSLMQIWSQAYLELAGPYDRLRVPAELSKRRVNSLLQEISSSTQAAAH